MPTVFVSVHSAKFTFAIFLRDKTHNVKETFCADKGASRRAKEAEEDANYCRKSNDVLLSEKDSCAAFSRKRRYSAAESGRRGAAAGTVKYASDNVSYLVFITI